MNAWRVDTKTDAGAKSIYVMDDKTKDTSARNTCARGAWVRVTGTKRIYIGVWACIVVICISNAWIRSVSVISAYISGTSIKRAYIKGTYIKHVGIRNASAFAGSAYTKGTCAKNISSAWGVCIKNACIGGVYIKGTYIGDASANAGIAYTKAICTKNIFSA